MQLGGFFSAAPTAQNRSELHFHFINSFIQPFLVGSIPTSHNFLKENKSHTQLLSLIHRQYVQEHDRNCNQYIPQDQILQQFEQGLQRMRQTRGESETNGTRARGQRRGRGRGRGGRGRGRGRQGNHSN